MDQMISKDGGQHNLSVGKLGVRWCVFGPDGREDLRKNQSN